MPGATPVGLRAQIEALICRQLKQVRASTFKGKPTHVARDALPHEVVSVTPAQLASIIAGALELAKAEAVAPMTENQFIESLEELLRSHVKPARGKYHCWLPLSSSRKLAKEAKSR